LEEAPYIALLIDYTLALEEWMRIKDGSWYLYADDLFLDINMHRDSERMNPQEPGGIPVKFFSLRPGGTRQKAGSSRRSKSMANSLG